MMVMKRIQLFVVFLWCVLCVGADNTLFRNARFTHVTCESGLSQNNVKAIAKDADGFLWFGTKNGLNRYDGRTIVRKNCSDGTVEGHDISALFAGTDGALWVGTESGLFVYQPKDDKFSYVDAKTKEGIGISHWVLNIAEDGDGNIWIVVPAQGVFRLCGGELSFYRVVPENRLKDTPLSHLYVRANGEVWLATWGSGLYRYERSKDTFIACKADKHGQALEGLKIVMMADYGTDLVLGIHEGRLLAYDPASNELSDLYCEGLSATMVRTLTACDGALWVGTYAGVFVWRDGRTVHLEKKPFDSRSLSDDVIYAVCADRAGGMWFGTLSGGVDYLPFTDVEFTKYTVDGLTAPLRVREMIQDSLGNIWVATENAGLCHWNAHLKRLECKFLDVDVPMVLSLAVRGDELICGTFMNGLYTVNTKTGAVRHHTSSESGLEEESIYALHTDRKGRIWLGTDHGLYRTEAGELSFRKVEMTGDVWIFDIFESQDGTLWLGTMGCGLWAYKPENATCRKYRHENGKPETLSGNSINTVIQDGKGRIWIATDGNGLCCLNENQNTFVTYSIREGFPDNVVYNVKEDGYGALWAGTNRGLVRLNPANGDVRVFTTESGLPVDRFNSRAALAGRDGRLYFGTIDGLVAFRPEQEGNPYASSPLYLTHFTVNNKNCEVVRGKDGSLSAPVHAENIRLEYDESGIGFGMALLDYVSPVSHRYYYRLEPLDEEWVMATDNRNISYGHLPPGHYVLHMKAVSGWSGAGAEREIRIEVLPPWWCTWWAYTLYIIIGIAVTSVTVLNYRRKQERRMRIRQRFFEMEKQKELYEAKVKMWEEHAGKAPEASPSQDKTAMPEPPVPTAETQPVAPAPRKGISEADKDWAERISQVVSDNLMDESFNVEAMAEILCMSRSTLLRRFKDTFDCSPVELIRMLRLNKAVDLIQEGRYRISDIGYMVGFNSASYFSKNFQKQFGVSPKDYAKRCREAKMKIEVANHFRVQDNPTA